MTQEILPVFVVVSMSTAREFLSHREATAYLLLVDTNGDHWKLYKVSKNEPAAEVANEEDSDDKGAGEGEKLDARLDDVDELDDRDAAVAVDKHRILQEWVQDTEAVGDNHKQDDGAEMVAQDDHSNEEVDEDMDKDNGRELPEKLIRDSVPHHQPFHQKRLGK